MDNTTENFWKAFAVWEEPTNVEQRYRLYHDAVGNPLYYSMAEEDGLYIEIDKDTYISAPANIKVIDGKLVQMITNRTRKLVPSLDGVPCTKTNVCIVVDESEPHTKWNVQQYT